MALFLTSEVSTVIITCIFIFFARILDVSIGTVRIILVSKGKKSISAVLGFFEVLIWLIAISKIIQNLTTVFYYIAYASGFAVGTYIGILIEEKIAIGYAVIKITTTRDPFNLIKALELRGYGITKINVKNAVGKKACIIQLVIRRKDIDKIRSEITKFNPNAFYSVEDIKYVNSGIFPIVEKHMPFKGSFLLRKSK